MKGYKLLRELKNGDISSLFINKKQRYNFGEWYKAENHKTNGYKERPYFHCTPTMNAPHLTKKGRVWVEVEMEGVTIMKRPPSQGGEWYLADKIKFIKKIKR